MVIISESSSVEAYIIIERSLGFDSYIEAVYKLTTTPEWLKEFTNELNIYTHGRRLDKVIEKFAPYSSSLFKGPKEVPKTNEDKELEEVGRRLIKELGKKSKRQVSYGIEEGKTSISLKILTT